MVFMNGFHGQLQRAKDDLSLKCCHRSKVARLGKAAIEWERERWKMASINFPRGDLHAFIKHEEEIGRDVFLSLSLIIFTLMCKATFFATSSRLWLVSMGQFSIVLKKPWRNQYNFSFKIVRIQTIVDIWNMKWLLCIWILAQNIRA